MRAVQITWEAALNVFGHCIQGFAYYYLLDHTVSSKFALCAWGAYDPKISCLERTCLVWGFPLLKLQMRTVALSYALTLKT
jgi:hypothetical protein